MGQKKEGSTGRQGMPGGAALLRVARAARHFLRLLLRAAPALLARVRRCQQFAQTQAGKASGAAARARRQWRRQRDLRAGPRAAHPRCAGVIDTRAAGSVALVEQAAGAGGMPAHTLVGWKHSKESVGRTKKNPQP